MKKFYTFLLLTIVFPLSVFAARDLPPTTTLQAGQWYFEWDTNGMTSTNLPAGPYADQASCQSAYTLASNLPSDGSVAPNSIPIPGMTMPGGETFDSVDEPCYQFTGWIYLWGNPTSANPPIPINSLSRVFSSQAQCLSDSNGLFQRSPGAVLNVPCRVASQQEVSQARSSQSSTGIPLPVASGNVIDYTLLEPIPGFLPTQTQTNASIEAYLVGMFRFLIGLAGLLAVIRITWCGFNLIMSVSPSVKEESKECVKLAILGLLLALGAYLLINTIQGSVGGSFAPPAIPSNGPSAVVASTPGSPECLVISSNPRPTVGAPVTLTASCAPAATSFAWISSGGGPDVTNTGGTISFAFPGTYTYIVQGINAAGPGRPSQPTTILIRPLGQTTGTACTEDMPQGRPGPFSCTQGTTAQTNVLTNDTGAWTGQRTDSVSIRSTQSYSYRFTTGAAGTYGSASTSAVTMESNVVKYANISLYSCDYQYDNLSRGACASYGPDVNLNFQVGGGEPPAETGVAGGCVLQPNTDYYINIRNEDPTEPGLNTCPISETCDFTLNFNKSADAPFVPQPTVTCTVADPNTGTPAVAAPTASFPTLTDGTSVLPGRISVDYTASDPVSLSSLDFRVYNLETGAQVDQQSGCRTPEVPVSCSASTTFPVLPIMNTLTLRNGGTGANIIPDYASCTRIPQSSPAIYECQWDFSTTDTANIDQTRVIYTQNTPTQTIVPNITCEPNARAPQCSATVSGTASLAVGPGQGTYRIVMNACGEGGCTTQTRTVVVPNACVTGQAGLTCFTLPGVTQSSQLCTPANGSTAVITTGSIHAHSFRLAAGESAKLIVANRPMMACPWVNRGGILAALFPPPVKKGEFVYAMTNVDVWSLDASGNPTIFVGTTPSETMGVVDEDLDEETYRGYRWRRVEFEEGNQPSGWVYEHLLKPITKKTPRGRTISDPPPFPISNWCSSCGMASTSLAGVCDFVRNQTLSVSIGRVPGQGESSTLFANDSSGVRGTCGTSFSTTGYFEILLKTSGAPQAGECVVGPDRDYYVNVSTQIDRADLDPIQRSEEYAVLLGGVTPPAPMCQAYIPPSR